MSIWNFNIFNIYDYADRKIVEVCKAYSKEITLCKATLYIYMLSFRFFLFNSQKTSQTEQ